MQTTRSINPRLLSMFANDTWSRASGITWLLVLLGFARHVFRLRLSRVPAATGASPTTF